MQLMEDSRELSAYLAADEAVDHHHPRVRRWAAEWGAGTREPHDYARAAYEYVRDRIPHSADAGDLRVTWRASDVLALRTGICHAKSHALVALLRAGDVPAGLCYQRLTEDDGTAPLVHGLVALKLPGCDGWLRQDPRGNTGDIDAQFSLERERLAFPVRPEFSEVDYPVLYAAPHPTVLRALKEAPDRPALWQTLPTAL
ncbi:transglutaminase family protein [Streptomyces sp. NPDC127068]|uniref:transglutaminase-like domain-containing protein n=1 Tax=Streptomyces sp. NPDC127068 TaxID=3347127 RepID=UPI003659EEC3